MKTVSVALAVAIFFGGVAEAQPPADDALPSATVSYTDIDVATPNGRKILRRRVASAINDLCLEVTGTSPLYFAQASCRQFAWKGARPQIDRLTLRASVRVMTSTGVATPLGPIVIFASPRP